MVETQPKNNSKGFVKFPEDMWEDIEKLAKEMGFSNRSEFVRFQIKQVINDEKDAGVLSEF